MLKWGKFLSADDDEQLHQLAMTDPIMNEAEQADPIAREEALKRQLEINDFEAQLRQQREEGKAEGLLTSIEQLCRAFGIELTTSRRHQLEASNPQALLRLLEAIARAHGWPDSEP